MIPKIERRLQKAVVLYTLTIMPMTALLIGNAMNSGRGEAVLAYAMAVLLTVLLNTVGGSLAFGIYNGVLFLISDETVE